ncbi:MAG: tRNA 4-thiouridine(8) synthase ThiI [Acidobacteria bacterium]|nr:tRNA 4-thiouridine(8) synthase ThiI [Acidobacteriota bacterium]
MFHVKQSAIVVHYHELWLKGGNRNFFIAKLDLALRRALEGIPVHRIRKPGDRMLIVLGEGADVQAAVARIERVLGVAYYAVARTVEHDISAICRACWDEMREIPFSTFAVRAKRSDKTFPMNVGEMEPLVGAYLLQEFKRARRDVRVKLDDPDVTCRIEITPGPALVYARRIPGLGGLPANTAGRIACLLSGGFDSAVAAFKMMKRGAHLTFVHFYGGGAQSGESSIHVARELVRKLVAFQHTAKLFLVPLDPIQREIVIRAPEEARILLYRRMMLRIAERLAQKDRCLALIAGDSLGQVASQTLQNMVAVGDAVRMPVFRPLAGDDKIEIINLPKNPALFSTPQELEKAEEGLNIPELVRSGVETAAVERFQLVQGRAEQVETFAAPSKKPSSSQLETQQLK